MVKKHTFNVSFSPENYQKLKKLSEEEFRSISNMIERIFLKHLEEEEAKKNKK